MMLERFLGPITVVICKLNTFRQIVLRYQHEMRTIAEHYGLGHQIAVARMIDESAKLAGLGGRVDAKMRFES